MLSSALVCCSQLALYVAQQLCDSPASGSAVGSNVAACGISLCQYACLASVVHVYACLASMMHDLCNFILQAANQLLL
jgi:hypothetical protein